MIDTKPFIKTLNDRPAAICGLGLSGLATAKALMAGGAKIVGWDDDEGKCIAAEKEGVPIFDFSFGGLDGYGVLVMAPGIPLYFPEPHPAVQKARDANVEIIGDIEILHRCLHGRKTVGITGTNGKSTTTMLVTHILNQAKINAVAGGNIGEPVLTLKPPKKDGVFVLEISSYQMDLCPTFRPDIAVHLNLTPDHLERHGTMEQYAAAKERMLEGPGIAVCGIDDAPSLAMYETLIKTGDRKTIPISVKKEIEGGVYVKDNMLIDHTGPQPMSVDSIVDIKTLPGVHNQQNICAAYAVCVSMGMLPQEILEHVKTYPGLPHRQFTTRVINGIAYVNDSKATNAEAAMKAIACYHNIYLIAGGLPKAGGLSGLEAYADRIRHVFLIGQAMDEFAVWCQKVGIHHTKSYTLDVAVLEAHKNAQANRGEPGGAATVLLSPACASWDQFKSFEHRGDVFASLVNALSDEVAA